MKVPAYLNNSHFGDKNKGSENKNPLTVWLPPCYKRALPEDVDAMEEDGENGMKEFRNDFFTYWRASRIKHFDLSLVDFLSLMLQIYLHLLKVFHFIPDTLLYKKTFSNF